MESVDVLLRAHGFRNSPFSGATDRIAEGKLNEDSVDGRILVESLDLCHDLVLARLDVEDDERAFNSGFCGGLELHLDVRGRVATRSELDDGEMGGEAGEARLHRRDPTADFRANLSGHEVAVDNLGGAGGRGVAHVGILHFGGVTAKVGCEGGESAAGGVGERAECGGAEGEDAGCFSGRAKKLSRKEHEKCRVSKLILRKSR